MGTILGLVFVGIAVLALAYVVWRTGVVNVIYLSKLHDEVKVLNEHLSIQPLAAWTEWLKAEQQKQTRRVARRSPMI